MRVNALSTYKNIDADLLDDIFSQTWDTNKSKLPPDIKRMVKVAKEYNLIMDGHSIPTEIKKAMPIWLHQGWRTDKNRITNNAACKCLQTNHLARTVGDVLGVAEQRAHPGDACENPERCQRQAAKLLDSLNRKWDPRDTEPERIPYTQAEESNVTPFPKQRQEIESKGDLYRIFTD
ncbi:hypothetical protein BDZ89DRAFT_947136, partial [Hymenopellis radicata]